MNTMISHRSLGIFLGSLLLLGAAPSAQAAFVISTTSPVSIEQGGTSYVEILLKNDSTGSLDLASFEFTVTLSGTGVKFSSATDQTMSHTYVFNAGGSGALTFDPLPTMSVFLSDFHLTGPVSLASGQTYGLARLGLTADANAPVGPRDISFSDIQLFSAATGSAYTPTLISAPTVSGGVEVLPNVNPVPCPPSAVLALIGGVLTLAGRRLRVAA